MFPVRSDDEERADDAGGPAFAHPSQAFALWLGDRFWWPRRLGVLPSPASSERGT
ncbi:MAG: hypothetical protein WCF04_04745 [Candidatus Nanopelagicales bacterium]